MKVKRSSWNVKAGPLTFSNGAARMVVVRVRKTMEPGCHAKKPIEYLVEPAIPSLREGGLPCSRGRFSKKSISSTGKGFVSNSLNFSFRESSAVALGTK